MGRTEAVLEAWAKRMGLTPVTLGDGYTGRGERKKRREAYRRGDPPEGRASRRGAAAGGGWRARRRLLARLRAEARGEPDGARVATRVGKSHTAGSTLSMHWVNRFRL